MAKALAPALFKRKCRLVTDNHLLLLDLTALGLDGAPAMTSRSGLGEDIETIADFLLGKAQITGIIKRNCGKSCNDFLKGLQNNKEIIELRNQVETFASQFVIPRFNV